MAFVKFTQSPGRTFSPKVSINTHGTMSFNNSAKKRFNLDHYTHCVLYYDAETRAIAVELTTDADAEGARKLRHRKTGADVSLKPFLDFFEINIATTTTFGINENADNNYLIVDLKTGKERRPRKQL